MANVIGPRQWVLDTVTAAVVNVSNVLISHMEFADYGADADTCTILDGKGHVVWTGNGASDLKPVRSGHIGWVTGGIRLSVLDSGKVRVYVE